MRYHRQRLFRFICLLCLSGFFCPRSSADELKLRDGTRITGTIVGYENDHFKVETSFGFALVRRDKVASITLSETKKQNSANSKPAPAKAPEPTAIPAASTAPPAAATAPPPPPPEPRIREAVEGNTYTNHVHGFRLYKPPSWQVIEGAHRVLPNAVVAMGTGDESTLLVVGREPMPGGPGALEKQALASERRLQEIYENYRGFAEERILVAGLPAVDRRFRGTVEGRDWSGRIVWVARGNELFTIFGMTYADSDLIQIQENVIARTIASLEFVKP